MPRTKLKTKLSNENVKPTKGQLKQESINCFLKSLEAGKNLGEEKIKAELERVMLKVNSNVSEICMTFPRSDVGKTLAELQIETPSTSSLDMTTFKTTLATTTRSAHRTTNPSTASKAKETLFRSRAASTIKKAKNTIRLSRSLSRSKLQQAAQSTLNSFTTPLQKSSSVLSFGTVTPKIKPNVPQVVLRRPKQGEMALSMQGSPLMVAGVSSDTVANVNIPLLDGRILSIQPQRGLRPSQLPFLDQETQRQIETLRDNLNKVCARVP